MVQNLEVKSPGLLRPTLALLLSIERCTSALSSLLLVKEVFPVGGRLAAGGAVFFFLGFVRKQTCFFFERRVKKHFSGF